VPTCDRWVGGDYGLQVRQEVSFCPGWANSGGN
jgi:hypothetical protein